jgi:dolichol-phosphate mannosyltransferase
MKPDVSIVIPAFHEEKCVAELHRRLSNVLAGLNCRYEILFVDDGSRDQTFQELARIAEHDPTVRALRLSRNFGHQAALAAGLAHAAGRAVISMDADLQHPPELIPVLLDRWREGYEVVYTVRRETADAGTRKKITSSLFYRLINFVSPVRITPGAADFRLLDRKAVDALLGMRERTLFLRGLIPWIGFKQIEVPFDAPERFAGATKYGYRKMLAFAINGILSLSTMPLRMAALFGGGVVGIGLAYGVYVVWTAITNPHALPGWASIILVLLLLGGAQIFFLGVIGEYLSRVFEEVKGRPLYIVAESIPREESPDEKRELD